MKYEKGDFYQIPRGMEKVVANIFEFVVLTRLLDRADDQTGASFPSYRDLTMGIMCRNRAIQSVKAIEKLGIITIEKTPFKANTYTYNKDKLLDLIKTGASRELVQDNNQSIAETSQKSNNVTLQPLQPTDSSPHALGSASDAPGSAPHEPTSAPHGYHDMHPNDNHVLTKINNDNHERKPSTTTSVVDGLDFTSLIITDYEKRVGLVSPMLSNNIADAVNVYGPDMVLEAIDKAVTDGKTKWSTVKTTLMQWQDSPHRTPKGYCSCLSAAVPIKNRSNGQ